MSRGWCWGGWPRPGTGNDGTVACFDMCSALGFVGGDSADSAGVYCTGAFKLTEDGLAVGKKIPDEAVGVALVLG